LKKFLSLMMLLALFLTLTPQVISTSYADPVSVFVTPESATTSVSADSATTSVSADSATTSATEVLPASDAALADPLSAVTRAAEAAAAAGRGTYPNGISIEGGDVLVTNNTSSSGLTGHAGIVTDATGTIASIAGYGHHPANQSMATWFSNNPNTVVVRNSDTYTAHAAGSWASSYVATHPNATYGLLNNMLNLNEVYCSKIPWLAYYSFGLNAGHFITIGTGYLITPYHWKNFGANGQQGFSTVATFGSW
jgi:uncharacterized protein YycO